MIYAVDAAELHIYDTAGRLMYVESNFTGNMQLTRGNLPAGTYFVILTEVETGEQATGKFVLL